MKKEPRYQELILQYFIGKVHQDCDKMWGFDRIVFINVISMGVLHRWINLL
jgi:hypothetical protein